MKIKIKIKFLNIFFFLLITLPYSIFMAACTNENEVKLTSYKFSESALYFQIKKAFKEKNYEDLVPKAEMYLKYFPYSTNAQDVFYMLAIAYKSFIFGPEYDLHFVNKLYDLSKKYLLLYPNGKYKKEFISFKSYAKNMIFKHKFILVKEEIKRKNYWAALDRLHNLCKDKNYKEYLERDKKFIISLFTSLKPKALSQIKEMIEFRKNKIKELKKKKEKHLEKKNIYANWISLYENEIKYLKKKYNEVKNLSCSL